MLCPSCFNIMENRDERHHVDPDSYRMNLHCVSKYHRCNSHMGVIVPPPYSNQEWICDHYNFTLSKYNKSFVLRATPSTPIISIVNNQWQLLYSKYKFTELLLNYSSPPIIRIPFVPISTNNDMHEHVLRLFNKLTDLIVFS